MKEFGELTKKGNKYKEITVTKLSELLKNGQTLFEEYWINGKGETNNLVKDLVIENITFNDCIFHGVEIVNNEVNNTTFVDCEFGFCWIYNNRVSASHSEQVLLDFFSNIQFNTFDRVTGNIRHENGFNTFNKNNVFRNMDFDGFTGIFYRDAFGKEGALSWDNNFFYNTTITLDAIAKLSDEARFIWNGRSTWDLSEERELSGEDVSEWDGPDSFVLDMGNMSKNGKINLVANIFTKLCKGKMIIAYEGYNVSNKSVVEFNTISNPLPIKIISNTGDIIDISRIKDINISTSFIPNSQEIGESDYLLYDGKLLEPMYVNGCDITNQKYHICRQLIKK